MPMPSSPLARLGAFQTELHACCTRRGDTLFELGDALLSADSFLSLPHLGCGGPGPATSTWSLPGGPTFAGSTWK
jgi:hypothetical protein